MKDLEICKIRDGEGWETLQENVLYDNDYIKLKRIQIKTPSRPFVETAAEWTTAHRKNAIVVAAQLKTGEFVLIKQERIPAKRTFWEFVAGQIDEVEHKENPDNIVATLHRELAEEAGLKLCPEYGELIPLGYFFSSQGFTDEHAYLFLAKNVIETGEGAQHDDTEAIVGKGKFTSQELFEMVAKNVITDANTLSLFARLCARGLIKSK